jgi:molybdopterin adenylyltransferase
MALSVAILTVSDRCAAGEEQDVSGPFIARWVTGELGAEVMETVIVPDEREMIVAQLIEWGDRKKPDLVLTTGGTGFAPRDVTPEATREVIMKEAPGLAEAMRSAGLGTTPRAMLSRAVAGIRNQTLIVNLPGSPKAVREYLEVLKPVLPHGIEILKGASEPYPRPGKEAG